MTEMVQAATYFRIHLFYHRYKGHYFPMLPPNKLRRPAKNFVASLKFGLSPTVINEVAFDYAYNKIQSTFTGTGLRSNTPGFTSPELFAGNLQGALPSITISGLQGLSFQKPAKYRKSELYLAR